MLKEHPRVSIPELAKDFDVSEMTIRRDLTKLQKQGDLKLTRGGAMPAERMVFEFDFAERRKSQKKEKKAIAEYANTLISEGDRIILDTGTTTLELAYLLKDRKDITVITPSLAVASVLQFTTGIETILLGGIIRKGTPDLTGAVTETTLDIFAADIAFQGADGIGEDGRLYNADLRIAKVDQKIRSCAEKTYILSDSSKIGKTALATNGCLADVEGFITDSGIPPRIEEKLKNKNVNIITVNV
jgi:DeoR/GlpR family transcriptional regulator of sugar metabolism